MKRLLALGIVLVAAAGCASGPAEPSKPAPPPPGAAAGPKPDAPHKVVAADTNNIRFHFDPLRTDLEKLSALAQAHCDKYDKSAQSIGVDAAARGLQQANFACVAGQQ